MWSNFTKKLYGIPYNAKSVLIIDPVTNDSDTTSISGLPGGGEWATGVTAEDDRVVYCVPNNGKSILMIDVLFNTTRLLPLVFPSLNSERLRGKWIYSVCTPTFV